MALPQKKHSGHIGFVIYLVFLFILMLFNNKLRLPFSTKNLIVDTNSQASAQSVASSSTPLAVATSSQPVVLPLDTHAYDAKLLFLAHRTIATSTNATSTATSMNATSTAAISTKHYLWPVKTVYPLDGAILPFKRIIAFYGNFYSKQMGVLGEYPEDIMLQKLQNEVKKWNDADPATKSIPALHYIAVTAQGSKGVDGKYRLRMPDSQIDKTLDIAKKIDALVFLDVQVGQSNVQDEVPLLEKYLKMPQVNLGIDPEFSMKGTKKPGTVIGTLDASDINYVAEYLAKLVRENNLPPKILVVHRFTQGMVTNANKITPLPEVQIVMQMDGWGAPSNKVQAYTDYIYREPVQFTGFKLFYKNDIRGGTSTSLMSPKEILKLTPSPSYIQYQ